MSRKANETRRSMIAAVASEWTLKAGAEAYWTYGERGILVTVKTVPKDANEKVTVTAPNGRDVPVPRSNLREPPSEEELALIAQLQDGT
jgi:hypothetical protein